MEQNGNGQAAQWTSLFDGRTMTGWRTYQNKPNESWSVQDGVLHCAGSDTDKSDLRVDLITEEQYDNFDFSIEWKIAPGSNTGIMYLVTEAEATTYLSGPEYQIIDDEFYAAEQEPWQKTGANYAMHPPTALPAKAIGEWNHTRIVINNARVEHWLNDVQIVTYELWTEEWEALKGDGKWEDAPNYGLARRGHIALQDHGSPAWFRNMKIRKL